MLDKGREGRKRAQYFFLNIRSLNYLERFGQMYINHLLPRNKKKFDLRDLRTGQYCFLFKHPNNKILFHLLSQI